MAWKKILQKSDFSFGLHAVGSHQLHMMLLMVSSCHFIIFCGSEERKYLIKLKVNSLKTGEGLVYLVFPTQSSVLISFLSGLNLQPYQSAAI